ncbi:CheY chemotaxis protein or a CheY-like REC (receiver) domain [Solitalea koreensis]|uniref:CheY chemotaxis protein or a CheY-like REC (Receiver) domain n=2 Tax=Solitalea koreensis TaxID=543615 RepID=A0A521ECZ4_9SPHI|nr:CheY chemotaxis protein or a CheY-like REC (receiver) domain [Solitalea koreensis]
MIVDDSKIDLFLHERFIQLSGICDKVISYNNAESALQYINENSMMPSELPAIVLLDIQMPEINGFEFLNRLQQFPESVRTAITIIMVSSTVDHTDINRLEDYKNVKCLLKKPLDPDQLKGVLEKINSNVKVGDVS